MLKRLARLTSVDLQNFVNSMNLLDKMFDVIIVDTGAGISDSVLRMVLAADEVILVTTPEPTSITDAYALIKMVSVRDNKKLIKLLVNRAENETEALQIFEKLREVTENL